MDDTGRVREEPLRRLVDFLIEAGCSAMVPVGGTGEYTALSPAERLRCVEITVDQTSGRVPVVAGILSPGYAEAVEIGKQLKDAGSDALLMISPFYARAEQPELRKYFSKYSADLDCDILYYDMPGRTGFITTAETVAAMEQDGSICGMKCCSIDTHYFNRLATKVSPDFALLSGEDTHYPIHALMGATGGILATSTVLPHYWVEIHNMIEAGDFRGAMKAQQALLPFLDAIFAETNPGPLKYVIEMLGLPFGEAMLPLKPPSEGIRAKLDVIVEDLLEQGKIRAIAA